MVLLHSEKTPLGTSAPDFSLPSVEGRNYSLDDFSGSKVLVLMFLCSHCPYVLAIEDRILSLAHSFSSTDAKFVAICSNDATDYPDDSAENLFKRWKEKQYGFPYLVDETQTMARNYGAVCTPDLYVFDQARKLAYRGQLDDSWKDAKLVSRQDLRLAIEALLRGEQPPCEQVPSMGCSIKWRK